MASDLTQATNDKEQLVPLLGKLKRLPKELGRALRVPADSGRGKCIHCGRAYVRAASMVVQKTQREEGVINPRKADQRLRSAHQKPAIEAERR